MASTIYPYLGEMTNPTIGNSVQNTNRQYLGNMPVYGAVPGPGPVTYTEPVIVDTQYRVFKITAVGQIVRNDINPIARLNFGVKAFNNACNKIKDIELLGVWTITPLSWLYDSVIYFYVRFLLTITCRTSQSGWILLFVVAIYIALLIAPIISVITFCISAIFFIYYCIGVIVYLINLKRLDGHAYTERMLPVQRCPAFSGQNEYFLIEGAYFQTFMITNNLQNYLQTIITVGQTKIMGYTEQFVSQGFSYIVSFKEIAFHLVLILIAIVGLVISVSAFPYIYGGK